MNLMTDLLWMVGAALSLGFLAYGAFLLAFVQQFHSTPATAAPRLHLAS
ncbi:MAG TPA: hypothetical protein VL199_14825 [Burkholderiales bacterium]|jgi:hypothetical protein|nr:hypothetical protein [Burkholderiales bacterium]